MVIDAKSGEPLHELSDDGWEVYAWLKLHEECYKAAHPISYFIRKNLLKSADF